MYQIQTCLYDVCICMYLLAHTYKISQLLCCLYVLQDTYNYKHAGSLMYNIVAAGYMGNNLSSGTESNLQYIRLNTVVTSGNTQRIALEVPIPSLTQYLKIRCKKTRKQNSVRVKGRTQISVRAPTISFKTWKKFNHLISDLGKGSEIQICSSALFLLWSLCKGQ